MTTRALPPIRVVLVAALAAGALVSRPAAAQQLEPRAYSPAPVGMNFVGFVYSNSSGDVVFDPSLPFSNVSADVNSAAPFYLRTFGLLGRSASAGLVLPYVWGTVEGDVQDAYRRADRSGLADAGLRFAVNLVGGPALTPRAFAARKPSTTLGASLTITGPTGQYDPSLLVNIGTNRWAFKPELGVSQPIGKWWLEFYAGAWLFTTNHDFYGGESRKQDPLVALQSHVVYEFKPHWWVALDATWYGGGSTTVGGVANNDRQNNTRVGLTLAIPLPKGNSIKLAYARGASSRAGSKLDTLSIGWQFFWFDRRKASSAPAAAS